MQITEVFETASPRPADAGGAGAGIGEGNDSIVEAAASVEPARTASDPAQAAGAMGGRRRRRRNKKKDTSTALTEVEVQSGEYATREDTLTDEQEFELGRISRLLSTGCTAYDILNVAQHTSFPYISIRFQWLSRLVHPYNCRGDARAATVFEAVRGSYEVLSDPQTRRQLDEAIIRQKEERHNAYMRHVEQLEREAEERERQREERERQREERERQREERARQREEQHRRFKDSMRERTSRYEQTRREHENQMRQMAEGPPGMPGGEQEEGNLRERMISLGLPADLMDIIERGSRRRNRT